MEQGHSQEHQVNIFKIAINLTLACLLSGVIIAGVYAWTAPIAKEADAQMAKAAKTELMPEATDFKEVNGHKDWFAGMKDGKIIGYIVPAEGKGYGGSIKMLLAVTPDAKVLDYKILSHNETPGLGDNASKPAFRGQFKGKSVDGLEVVKNNDSSKIQAMTGATISSRAVTNAVKNSLVEVKDYLASNK